MSLPTLLPIRDEDLPDFCRFLNENLSDERSAEAWAEAFRQPWCRDKPNNGFLLRSEGRVVGGIGAIYADRTIRGQECRFCNITSWCVQDTFRSQSMRLAMAVTSQPGLHFTDLTPTAVVSKTLQFLKFKPMDERHAVFANYPAMPSWLGGASILTDTSRIEALLSPADAKALRDHVHLPWLRHLAVGRDDAWCHIVWKPTRLRNIAGAIVLAVSDPELFLRCRPAVGGHFLLRHGLPYLRIEIRLLPRVEGYGRILSGYQNKVYRSDSLGPADIGNLYTELVALDL